MNSKNKARNIAGLKNVSNTLNNSKKYPIVKFSYHKSYLSADAFKGVLNYG